MQNSPQDVRKKILGRKGESLACRYAKRRGLRILERNYCTPFGEADIVALDRDVYVFIEVKTRITDTYGGGAEAVTRAKQQKYRRIAQYFCSCRGEEVPVRFDVIAVDGDGAEYFKNAFY